MSLLFNSKLINISSNKRTIYLFCRDLSGNLTITPDNSFFPYYYEPVTPTSTKLPSMTVDGKKVQKILVSDPLQIRMKKSPKSYESDVVFTRRYLIDKIPQLDKTIIKSFFIDIEVLATELPIVREAKYPISCVTIYNSLNSETKSWALTDFNGLESEKELIREVIKYIKIEKPDMLLAWNIAFDYGYLHYRNLKLNGIHSIFAKEISPIGEARHGEDDLVFPSGISILDYLKLFKKVYMRESSYTLDSVSIKHLNETAWKKVDFGRLTADIKEKNINDVHRMVKLEKKFQLIPYYDEVRRMSKCLWEDLYYNSRIVEALLFEEAKKKRVVLPNKPEGLEEKEEFEGAYREAFKTGAFKNITKYDIGSAYPNSIINFCLDGNNIVSEATNNTIEIGGFIFKQNYEALLPSIVKKIMTIKNTIKSQKETLSYDSPEYKTMATKYDAIKAIVNSCYGVMGNRFFRLYSRPVAETTTFLVRDLLHYVKDKLEASGIKVIYIDTDSVFLDSPQDLTKELNQYVQEWAKEKYGKSHVDIEFEYEGIFEKLLIVAKCRYFGYIRKKKGVEEEIKGVEVKRNDSSKYMGKFQRELINRILNDETREQIEKWIDSEKERMKTLPIEEVAFPCKVAAKEGGYKNIPIFIRALSYTSQLIPQFKKVAGEGFYYIYVEPIGYDETKANRKVTKKGVSEIKEVIVKKAKDVLAFDDEYKNHIKNINWEKMTERNIGNKYLTIFAAMGWAEAAVEGDENEE
jgi:DNA polymerase elongation subunit (family B)